MTAPRQSNMSFIVLFCDRLTKAAPFSFFSVSIFPIQSGAPIFSLFFLLLELVNQKALFTRVIVSLVSFVVHQLDITVIFSSTRNNHQHHQTDGLQQRVSETTIFSLTSFFPFRQFTIRYLYFHESIFLDIYQNGRLEARKDVPPA